MTDYVKSTNFTSKDSLAIGNPLKIVKGTEIDTEFNNIAVAVATKADIANPTFTGTVAAPTPLLSAAGTTVATVAAIQALYPVGSIYINAGVTTNPSTLLGFGTWVAFGAGRVMVGFNGADSLFDTLEETGGSKDATLVSHSHTWSGSATTGNQSADHSHTYSGTTSGVGDHAHSVPYAQGGNVGGGANIGTILYGETYLNSVSSGSAGAHSHTYSGTTSGMSSNHTHNVSLSGTTSSNGSSATNANLQPYITVAMWKRTA